jgi:hypothetical protein
MYTPHVGWEMLVAYRYDRGEWSKEEAIVDAKKIVEKWFNPNCYELESRLSRQ